jgi:hypothetical protein
MLVGPAGWADGRSWLCRRQRCFRAARFARKHCIGARCKFPVAERIAGPDEAYWQSGEGTLEVASSASHSGRAEVQLFHRCWPDAMVDPGHDPALFDAWSRQHFGVLAFPYGLARAAAQPRAPSSEYVAFVKLSWSSTLPESEEAPSHTDVRRVLWELSELARVAAAVCEVRGALAWFSPKRRGAARRRKLRVPSCSSSRLVSSCRSVLVLGSLSQS